MEQRQARGRFAAARLAHQPERLTPLHRERDVVERMDRSPWSRRTRQCERRNVSSGSLPARAGDCRACQSGSSAQTVCQCPVVAVPPDCSVTPRMSTQQAARWPRSLAPETGSSIGFSLPAAFDHKRAPCVKWAKCWKLGQVRRRAANRRQPRARLAPQTRQRAQQPDRIRMARVLEQRVNRRPLPRRSRRTSR